MGITLQEYRISIGTYSNSGLPKFGNKYREKTYKDKQDARIEWINKRLSVEQRTPSGLHV